MIRAALRVYDVFVLYHTAGPEAHAPTVGDRLRLLPRFAKALAGCRPAAWRWARYRDPAARRIVKQRLGLLGDGQRAISGAVLERPQPVAPPKGAAVTIVMPVYGNLSLTREALRRVAAHTDLPWRIILIDDASPDAETLPALREWALRHDATLIEHDRNQGFVASANAGLAAARRFPDPVVLLNTDALLPPGWAPRLLSPIWADPDIASATPLSNDAELGSVPLPGQRRAITAETADAIDAVAAGLNGAARVDAPAGVGFCMAIARAALNAAPEFDMAFSPGYGEEVDWCQALLAKGFRHVYVPNLFVAHIGGTSFGSETKRQLIAKHAGLLDRRYPRFTPSVHRFLRDDPLHTARMALALAWAEAERTGPLPIYIAHGMGGGAEIDLMRRCDADLTEIGAAAVLRFGGIMRFGFELWQRDAEGLPACIAIATNALDDVLRLLAPIAARRVVYSCAVGDPDPIDVPRFMAALASGKDDTIAVLIHDYFPLSPNYSLLEDGERWEGMPRPDAASARHSTLRPDGSVTDLTEWRSAWAPVMRRATEVTCFSKASADLVRAVYPETCVAVRPHALHHEVPRIALPDGPPVIGILGNLAPHKGARVAEALSRHLRRTRAAKLVLLGQLDAEYRLVPPAKTHGAYDIAALPELVARYGITCWLIPSLWPETFSFATHEALATGLPVMAFDLGAQGDAVSAALSAGAPGRVLPLTAAENPAAIVTAAVALSEPVA